MGTKGYAKLTFLSPDKEKEIQGDFLVDTGADISIINYETFKAIASINPRFTLEQPRTVVRAVNKSIIKFEGKLDLQFQINDEDYIDVDEPIKFKHSFWIAKENSVKSNILGMDWLTKQCESIKFDNNYLILKQYSNKGIELATNRTINAPFFEVMNAIKSRSLST